MGLTSREQGQNSQGSENINQNRFQCISLSISYILFLVALIFYPHIVSSEKLTNDLGDLQHSTVRTIFVRDLLASGIGAVHFDLQSYNYTQLIELANLKSLYVVANGNKLLRLSNSNLRIQASFELPKPSSSVCETKSKISCDEQSAFTLLSETYDKQNIWYCYIYQINYLNNAIIPNVDSARCEIPMPLSLDPDSRLVQWENTVYASLNLNSHGVHLMATDGFLYTAGWFLDGIHIHRVRLPNFNGLPNWDGFLTTPTRSEYISEPAEFILTFETAEEVFFLFHESVPSTCTLRVLNRAHTSREVLSLTGYDRQWRRRQQEQKEQQQQQSTQQSSGANFVTVTRLARLCKGDRGGYAHINEDEFATFAKATLKCTTQSESGAETREHTFRLTRATFAYWDALDERLYVLFSTPKGFPNGMAVCVYTREEINAVFRGDLLNETPDGRDEPVNNLFPNICSRFSSPTLTEGEIELGRKLSRQHLLRWNFIRPMTNGPILTRQPSEGSGDENRWTQLTVDHVGSTRVLYLATRDRVERYRLLWTKTTENNISACLFDQFSVQVEISTPERITSLGRIENNPPVCGESGDIPEHTINDFRAVLPDILSGYELKNVFNYDETALYYKVLSDKTLEQVKTKATGSKKNKERITVLVGAKMCGEKLPLLVIGKYKNPRCFRGRGSNLPLHYNTSKNAWMTTAIFNDWLVYINGPMVEQNREILLSQGHFYILTSRHVLRIPKVGDGCDRHADLSTCNENHSPYCIWDDAIGLCVPRRLLPPDSRSPKSHETISTTCPIQPTQADGTRTHPRWWSMITQAPLSEVPSVIRCPHHSLVQREGLNLTCWCKLCTNCNWHKNGPALEIVNCTVHPTWSPWSSWSTCWPSCGNGLQTRTRTCLGPSTTGIIAMMKDIPWQLQNCLDGNEQPRAGDMRKRDTSTHRPRQQMELQSCSIHPICEDDEAGWPTETSLTDPSSSEIASFWSKWSPCTNACGFGVQSRRRICRLLSTDSQQTDCQVLLPAASETRVCRNVTCAGSEAFTKWTDWFLPRMVRSEGNNQLYTSRHTRQRMRFTCLVSSKQPSQDLRVGRVQYVERKCNPRSNVCTPSSDASELNDQVPNPPSRIPTGHWAPWSEWSPCPTGCVPLARIMVSSVPTVPVQNMNSNPYTQTRHYSHETLQTRHRVCHRSDGTSECAGGPAGMRGIRNCPSAPACQSGWTCWSEWSTCSNDHTGGVNYGEKAVVDGRCWWNTNGRRKRMRQCVIGAGSDWKAPVELRCDGPTEETEACAFLTASSASSINSNQGVECAINAGSASWTQWSTWTPCDNPINMDQPLVNMELYPVRKRIRRCILSSASNGNEPQSIQEAVFCFGPWSQIQTCASGALQTAAASVEDQFTTKQLLLIGFIGFLFGLIFIVLLLIIYRFGFQRSRTRPPREWDEDKPVLDSPDNQYLHPYSPNRFGPDVWCGGENMGNTSFAEPLQPILTIPPHVKSDQSTTRGGVGSIRHPTGRYSTNPAIYDSVASQDLPTYLNYPEGDYPLSIYSSQQQQQQQQQQPQHSPLITEPYQIRHNYWSLPRRSRTVSQFPTGAIDNLTRPSDLELTHHMSGSSVLKTPPSHEMTSTQSPTDNYPQVNPHEHLDGRVYQPPTNRTITDPSDEKRTLRASDYPRHPSYTPRCRSDFSPRTNRTRISSASGQKSSPSDDGTNAIMDATSHGSLNSLPPAMPLLPVLYKPRRDDEISINSSISPKSSIEWLRRKKNRQSEFSSICLERPQNPHLQERSESDSPELKKLADMNGTWKAEEE